MINSVNKGLNNENFDTFGVMIDCSRDGVMNLPTLKRFIGLIAKMGYNSVMLYTEDTFEVDGEPLFGYMRGRYTKDEIREIDQFCKSKGVELIPCIQTLAHLNCYLKWEKNYDIIDCDDILLVDNNKTYELIDRMFKSISECFSSKKIHIGMDEADKVGLGKHLQSKGYEDRFNIINRHLHKVSKLAEKYDMKPMIWSDMFCRLAFNMESYHDQNGCKDLSLKADIPENVTLVYWDYYSTDYDHYKKLIEINKSFNRHVVFAGGAWTWKGFAPDNKYSLEIANPSIKACIDTGIRDVFLTMWGDDGGECSKFAVLPSLFYNIEMAKGNTDITNIKTKFKTLVGLDFDAFMMLDGADTPSEKHGYNTSKYLLYNDIFCGLNDYKCDSKDDLYYKKLEEDLEPVCKNMEYGYIFDTIRLLCSVLAIKSDIGIRLRKAYQTDDRKELRRIADEDITEILKRIDLFYTSFEKQWHIENKPFGFDVHDIRIGGLIGRIKACKRRLLEYVDNKREAIPELAEKTEGGKRLLYWNTIVTPNVL